MPDLGISKANSKARSAPSYSSEHAIWRQIIQRCTNPKLRMYHRYGGRGIKVCERWKTYANFIADVGERPSPQHQIDRIDNNGDYEPGNVRWATRSEQQRNKIDTVFYTVDGIHASIVDHCERLGMSRDTVRRRIKKGLSVDMIFKPTNRKRELKSRRDGNG